MPDSLALQTVVIQATRAGSQSPVPHNNLTAKQISQNYHAQDVPFLLTGLPSVVETSDAGAGIGYTGLRVRGSDQTRINVTLNGVPVNDAESQQVFWVDLPDLAASASEIQVQRGVGTSTNGAGAFGATVNVDISKVEAEPTARLSGTVGSFGTQKFSGQFGTGLLGGHWAFSGRLSQIKSDGWVERASSDLNSAHLSAAYVDGRQSVQFHVLDGHEITYQSWYGLPAQFLENDALRRFNPAGTERPGSPYPDQVDDYRQTYYLLHFRRQMRHGLSLQLNGHYTRGRGFYEEYKAAETLADYGLPPLFVVDTAFGETDLVRRRWLDNHFFGSTFALRFAPPVNPPFFARPPVFTLGGAVSQYLGQHFGEVIWAQFSQNFGVPARYYDNDADKRDANIYLQTELAWRGGWATFLDLQIRGVRHEFLGFDNDLRNVTQSARFLFFNPKMGVSKRLGGAWTAYSFVGIGNREPNRNDFTQSSPASRPKSERLLDVETGVKASSAGWRVAANLFWMRYRDQLVLDGRLNDVGAYIRTNVPRSHRAGIELEAETTVLERLQLAGNVALSQNKAVQFTEFLDDWDTGGQLQIEHENTDLAFSPNVIGRAEAGFLFVKKTRREAAISLAGKYVGSQFLDNTSNAATQLPGYFVADARLNVRLENRSGQRAQLVFSVLNFLNTKYVSNGWAYRYVSAGYDARPDDPYTRLENGSTYHQAGFFPQAGRQFYLTVSLEL
ncbi:MAG: TonB-dependent receptor [Saprospiraceae bacterium]